MMMTMMTMMMTMTMMILPPPTLSMLTLFYSPAHLTEEQELELRLPAALCDATILELLKALPNASTLHGRASGHLSSSPLAVRV